MSEDNDSQWVSFPRWTLKQLYIDQTTKYGENGCLSIICKDFNRDCLINFRITPVKGGIGYQGKVYATRAPGSGERLGSQCGSTNIDGANRLNRDLWIDPYSWKMVWKLRSMRDFANNPASKATKDTQDSSSGDSDSLNWVDWSRRNWSNWWIQGQIGNALITKESRNEWKGVDWRIGQKFHDKSAFINANLLGRSVDDDLAHRITLSTMEMLGCLQVSLSVQLAEAIAWTQNNIPACFAASGHIVPYSDFSFPPDATRFIEPVMATSRWADTRDGRVLECGVGCDWRVDLDSYGLWYYKWYEEPKMEWTDRVSVREKVADLRNFVIRARSCVSRSGLISMKAIKEAKRFVLEGQVSRIRLLSY